ncbi:MAG: zf-HC2 domain-containing protein [Lachnospiraceae bacterium]
MNCKEIEKCIPLFIDNTLDEHDLIEFINHIEICEDCREELNIQFLVMAGMTLLEDGTSYDLDEEMRQLIITAKRKLVFKRKMRFFTYFTIGCLCITILVIIMQMID